MYYLIIFLFCILGYLFGSVLFAEIIGRLNHNNIRASGSGNPGATNLMRISKNKFIAFLAAILDGAKAYLVVVVCSFVVNLWYQHPNKTIDPALFSMIFISGIFCVIGHCFPIIFLIKLIQNKFDYKTLKPYIGGKGVMTFAGIIFALSPWIGLIAFGIWAILISITRYVSLASMCAILIATCLIWIKQLDLIYLKPMTLGDDYSFIGMSFIWLMLGCLLIILRHKSNIVRMFKHTESKAFSKK